MRRDILHIPLWIRAPFIRLLPPFVLGIITAYFFDVGSDRAILGVAAAFAIIAALYEKFYDTGKFRYRFISGTLLIGSLFLLGILVFKIHDIRDKNDWYGHYLHKAQAIKIVVKDKPQEKNKTYKIIGKMLALLDENEMRTVRGKALFYIQKDSLAEQIRQGDVLIVANGLNEVKSTGHPGAFDYKKYLSFQGIYHQGYVRNQDWLKTGHRTLNFVTKATNAAAAYSQRTIEKLLHGHHEISLAKALLTGDRSSLDRDLVEAYANTGVVHIMAISGLHIGLIYLFLIWIFGLIPVIKRNNGLKFALVLVGVWFFAFMTGLSPSVMRASTMFSFLTLGILKRYSGSTYNFWAAAAFFLLCFNPLLLFHVGFQLSFTAVLGILVAQRSIYKWIYFENKIVDYIWEIVSITLSAQLFTLPFIAYYFHQFPILFIIANIVAIPLASIGLWLGILLLIFSWVPVVSPLLGIATEWVFRALNKTIVYINTTGFSVWDGFYPNLLQSVLLMSFISGALYWLLYRNKTAFKFSLFVLIGLLCINSYKAWRAENQNCIVFYDIPRVAAVDFIVGNRYFHRRFTDSEMGDRDVAEMNIVRDVLRATLRDTAVHAFRWDENEVFIGKRTVLYLKTIQYSIPKQLEKGVDVLVLHQDAPVELSELLKTLHPDLLVFTPANRRYLVEKWKKECAMIGLEYHDIYEDGALILRD